MAAKRRMFSGPEKVAQAQGLSERMARVLLKDWVKEDWLAVADPSRRKRAHVLTAEYRQYRGARKAGRRTREL